MGVVFDKKSAQRISRVVKVVETAPIFRGNELPQRDRVQTTHQAKNVTSTVIPIGGIVWIREVHNSVYYVSVPICASLTRLGVAVSPIQPGEYGSIVTEGIARVLPYNSAWISSAVYGKRWNIYKSTCYATPQSHVGPFICHGADANNGFVLLEIDTSKNFGV